MKWFYVNLGGLKIKGFETEGPLYARQQNVSFFLSVHGLRLK